jgi:hypothetical protein
MSDAITRNQAFALRLLADLTRMPPERRGALRPEPPDDAAYLAALVALEDAVTATVRSGHVPPVDRFFAAADLIIDAWGEAPSVAAPLRAAVRAIVLHSEPGLGEAFHVLYRPLQAHVPFEELMLG